MLTSWSHCSRAREIKELNSLLESLPDTGSVSYTRQQKPLGLGHAVWCARHLVEGESFAVLLPDDLMIGKPGALKQMVEAYNKVGGGVIVAAEEKPRESSATASSPGATPAQSPRSRASPKTCAADALPHPDHWRYISVVDLCRAQRRERESGQ
jgi:UTP--glucose-1-phosphate uridylyltransferase